MKVVLAALLVAAVQADNKFDLDTDSDADLVYSVVAGGDENTITEEYAFIGGGFRNSVDGAYGVATGGYKNIVMSNYGTITGGFLNVATGRFASVIGGARNAARGRFSLASGYKADAKGDHTAAFGFSGDKCATTQENQIAFCADSFLFNGLELLDLFSRRSLSVDELDEVVEAQTKVIDSQNDRISRIEALLETL